MKTAVLAMALLLAGPAMAQVYKCKNAQGKIELSDTACGVGSSGDQVMAKPTSSGPSNAQLQDQRAIADLQQARASLECQAATETLRHNDNRTNRGLMRQACGLPEPAPSQRARVNCSTYTQGIGGNQAIGTTTCR